MESGYTADSNYCLGEKWLENEFKHVDFGDKRLTNRLVKTVNSIEGKASGSINQSCRSWKEAKGSYRLLSNTKVAESKIYASHYHQTSDRIKGNKLIFSIQDTTELDFDSHPKTKGLGSVSKAYKKHKMGLLLHSALSITPEGLPLGITSQQCWSRPLREETVQEKGKRIYRTSINNKESYKWITALKETVTHIPDGTQLVTLGDRELDIFEFFWEAELLGTSFVVRNRQNRRFICGDGTRIKLQSYLHQLAVKKKIKLHIPKKANQKARKATVALKYTSGFLPIRRNIVYGPKDSFHKSSDRVAVSVVNVQEINPPKGAEAIEWTLLTNVPVCSIEEAIERISWYTLRWQIEEYFRVLKSGCKIENSRLSTRERLQKLIAIKSIIAFKILYLTKVAKLNPEEICTHILSPEEWKTLYIREHKSSSLPKFPPTIRQAIIWLGKLGGFMNRKNDKFPGTMTLWRGYENLKESILMLYIIKPQSCG
jgi:hypothetical protein